MSTEGALEHAEYDVTNTGVGNGKLATWIFLASEVMFFSGLICSYIVLRWGAVDWPNPSKMLNIPLTAFNTFLLICSSVTMVKALSAAQRDDKQGTTKFLACTVGLGMCFLGVQAYEYTHLYAGHVGHDAASTLAPLTPSGSMFGATFYCLTGFHGAHVTLGVLWMMCVLYQSAVHGRYSSRYNIPIELAGLYWHFVDLVWIILFTIVYLV